MHRGSKAFWRTLASGTLLFAAGCGISDPHPPVAGARIFSDDADFTEGIVLSPFDTVTLEVYFVDEGDRQIPLSGSEHTATFQSLPANFLILAPDIAPFRAFSTVMTTCATGPREIQIGYGHWGHGDERTFRFPVVVENPVGSVRLFDATGVERTSPIVIPAGGSVVLEGRFRDCDGQPTNIVRQDIAMGFELSGPGTSYTVARIPGERFKLRLTAGPTPVSGVQLMVTLGKGETPSAQQFGPFNLQTTAN